MTETYSDSWSPPAETGTNAGDASTTTVAKDQVKEVGSGAVEAGGQVASTAVDQGKQVAAEALTQVRDLAGEARQHALGQVGDQHQKAVTSLRGLGDSLHALASGDTEAAPGLATDLASQAADKVHEIATFIESREPGELMDEVRDLARRRPGAFLVGALIAGVAMGRLTRGVVAAQHEETSTPAAPGTPVRTYAPAHTESFASSDTFGAGVTDTDTPIYAETGSFDSVTGNAYPATTYADADADIVLGDQASGQVRP